MGHKVSVRVRVGLGSIFIVLYNSISDHDVFKCVKVQKLSSNIGWLVGMYSGFVNMEFQV